MYHRLAAASMIVLIVAALLASRAAGPVAGPQAHATATTPASTGERSVERRHGAPAEHGGVRRTALLRAATSAISRAQPPSGAAGTEGSRGAALGADLSRLELVMGGAGAPVGDVSRGRVFPPERLSPPSRAPPSA